MNDDLLKAADALRDNCHVLRMRADDAENENAILKAERDALRKLAEAIVRLESSPLQTDYVPPSIQAMARAALKGKP